MAAERGFAQETMFFPCQEMAMNGLISKMLRMFHLQDATDRTAESWNFENYNAKLAQPLSRRQSHMLASQRNDQVLHH